MIPSLRDVSGNLASEVLRCVAHLELVPISALLVFCCVQYLAPSVALAFHKLELEEMLEM